MVLWNNNLLIGIPEIDEQHKKLVQALEELSEACFKGQGKDKVEKTLNFVADYTKKHFLDEEKLHVKNLYPQATAHKELHKEFIKNLTDIQNDVRP